MGQPGVMEAKFTVSKVQSESAYTWCHSENELSNSFKDLILNFVFDKLCLGDKR